MKKKAVLVVGDEVIELSHGEKIPTSGGVLGYSDDAKGVWFVVDANVANPPRFDEPCVNFKGEWQNSESELWLQPGDSLLIGVHGRFSYTVAFEELRPAEKLLEQVQASLAENLPEGAIAIVHPSGSPFHVGKRIAYLPGGTPVQPGTFVFGVGPALLITDVSGRRVTVV